MNVFIIAEAGINHGGNVDVAFELIDQAHDAGADAVKFQAFTADRLEPPGDRRELLRGLELRETDFVALADYARSRDIEFMATPFDEDWLAFLVERCGLRYIKIASTSITDMWLIRAAAATGLPTLLSTGMATWKELCAATDEFPAGADLTLMYCVSSYPTLLPDIRLGRLSKLYSFRTRIGLSDHTLSVFVPALAVALGCTVIEKHFTCAAGSGPDHAISLGPEAFAEMVSGVRQVYPALNTGRLGPLDCEASSYLVRKEREEWRALYSATAVTDA